jgi:hypothetical protein
MPVPPANVLSAAKSSAVTPVGLHWWRSPTAAGEDRNIKAMT